MPVMTRISPAPEAGKMVKFRSVWNSDVQHQFQGWKAALISTILCTCSDSDEACENGLQKNDGNEYIDDGWW